MADAKYTLEPQTKILLADLGISHSNVLRRAGLPGDLLDRTAVTLSSGDYHRLWDAFQAESGDPALPLRITEAQTVAAFTHPSSPRCAAPTSTGQRCACRPTSR